MNKDNFIKVDKEFYNNLSSKEILILLYLYNKSLTLEQFKFTLKDLITYYGYKTNSRKNQINEHFVEAIDNLIKKDIIYLISPPIKNINQIIIGGFNKNHKEKTYFDTLDEFIMCFSSEIYKISLGVLNNITTCRSFEKIIQVYLYLKKFLNSNNPMQYSYPSLNTMSQDLNISKPTILKILNDLEKLKMIYKKNIGNYIDKKGRIFTCNNLYCFENYNIEELKQDFSHSIYNFYKWY